jgi:hypothetical protein
MKDKSQWVSFGGVILLAILLPGVLRAANSVVKFLAGAEGRLAAITVDTNYSVGSGIVPTEELLSQKDDKWKSFLTYKALPQLNGERLNVTGDGSWVRAVSVKTGETYKVLLANFDPNGRHSEVVPVNFLGLPEQKKFVWRTTVLGATTTQQEVTSNGGLIQKEIALPINSFAVVELEPSKP